MALILKKSNIITSDDRIIRDVTYIFLKPYINEKTTMQVECVCYGSKEDVFPTIVEPKEGEEPTVTTTQGPKGVLLVTIDSDFTVKDLTTDIHKKAIEKLQEIDNSLSLSIDNV
jgi:hypothetical protein